MWGTSFRQRLRLLPLFCALWTADALRGLIAHRGRRLPASRPGVSVVIPDRDAPDLLCLALASAQAALANLGEAHQIVVVANGAPRSRYAGVLAQFPQTKLIHSEAALGFSAAIARGLQHARHDWTLLLNNDMTLAPDALTQLARARADDVFAIGAQIFQRSASGRREETGLTDWYLDRRGVELYHADPGEDESVRPQLCASGGAALFRTRVLRRYARSSICYDPFYWEDVEWSVRAWRDGLRVLFCPRAHAWHQHRATVARFYDEHAIARVTQRNRLLFEARHRVNGDDVATVMTRACEEPYDHQRELARPSLALAALRLRVASACAPQPLPPPRVVLDEKLSLHFTRSGYGYRLRSDSDAAQERPRVLLVSPFCVFPPRHGGARRIAELLRVLRRDFNIILVSDEALQYDARSYAHFDQLHAVHLVQRRDPPGRPRETTLSARMASHCHANLRAVVREAIARHRPQVVQIEHVELAPLVDERGPGEHWVLTLHDAHLASDFGEPDEAQRFQERVIEAYDAIAVCSEDDAALIDHPRVLCIPNGARAANDYAPSRAAQMLFMGPFRYAQNLQGIRSFLNLAFPAIRSAVPDAQLVVLGGDEAAGLINGDDAFRQDGVRLYGHREDVPELLRQSALTVNPLSGIRGSAIKLIESLMAGRACVSTLDGARGFQGASLPGLVSVAGVRDMVGPIVALLQDEALRHRTEAPQAAQLAPFQWEHSAGMQRALYQSLLRSLGA